MSYQKFARLACAIARGPQRPCGQNTTDDISVDACGYVRPDGRIEQANEKENA